MAKELPYYKHEPSEWLEGEIQACSDAAIVCFTNLCSGYWIKLGCMGYAFALHKYCRKDNSIMDELISHGIIDKVGEDIRIKFLDSQLTEFNSLSVKRSEAANKRWSDANALQSQSTSNAIREDKSKGNKKKETNVPVDLFDESKTELSNPDKSGLNFPELLNFINQQTGRKFQMINDSVKAKFKARLKEGYTRTQIGNAIKNACNMQYHKENGFQYLTPEFFSRATNLDKYGTMISEPKKSEQSFTPKTERRSR
jgi:uncharacterized phage protein (TIGR02220 family)